MLGFSTFSETPFAQAATSLAALAFMASAASQGYAGIFGYDAKAFYTLNPAVSSTAVAIEFDAKASTNVVSVLSSLSINDLLGVDAQATISPSAVVATFSADTLSYDAKANLTLGSVTSDILAYDLADVDAQANTTLSSTSAYLTIYITDFADEDAQARAFMSPAVAVGSVDVDFDAKANTFSSSVNANLEVSEVDFNAKANITTGDVTAIISINNFYDVDAQATANITSLLAVLYENLEEPVSVQFPYSLYSEDYDRNRIVYLVSYDNNRTSHVVSQNNTVYITGTQESNIVHVVPENYTVYIQKLEGSNTVHIAA